MSGSGIKVPLGLDKKEFVGGMQDVENSMKKFKQFLSSFGNVLQNVLDPKSSTAKAVNSLNEITKKIREQKAEYEALAKAKAKAEAEMAKAESKARENTKIKPLSYDEADAKLRQKEGANFDKKYVQGYEYSSTTGAAIPVMTDSYDEAIRKLIEDSKDLEKAIKEALENDSAYQKAKTDAEDLQSQFTQVGNSIEDLSVKQDQAQANIDSAKGWEQAVSTLKQLDSLADKVLGKLKKMATTVGSVVLKAWKKVTSSLSQHKSGVDGIVGSIKKMALAIFGARSAYYAMRKVISSVLEDNQKLQNTMTGFWASIGGVLEPVINAVISGLATIMNYIMAIIKTISGINIFAKANAKIAKSTASSAASTAKSNEKTLASFDEINKLNNSDSSGGGGGSGVDTGSYLKDLSDNDLFKQMKDLIDAGDWFGAGKLLAEAINDMIDSVDWEGIGTKIGQKLQHAFEFALGFLANIDTEAISEGLMTMFTSIFANLSPITVGQTIGEFFNRVVDFVNGFVNDSDKWAFLGEWIGSAFNNALYTFNWANLGQTFTNFWVSFLTFLTNAIETINWSQIGEKIKIFFDNIDWDKIAESAYKLGESIKEAFEEIDWSEVLTSIIEGIGGVAESIGSLVDGALGTDLKGAFEWLTEKLTDLVQWMDENPDKAAKIAEAILKIVAAITAVMVVIKVIATVTSLINGISLAISLLTSPIGLVVLAITAVIAIIAFLIAKWDELSAGFQMAIDNIKTGWQDFCERFNETIDGITGAVGDFIDSVVEFFTSLPDKIYNVLLGIYEWVVENITVPLIELISSFIDSVVEFFTNLWNSICEIFLTVCEWIQENITTPIIELITLFIESVVEFFTNLWDTICTIFEVVCDWVNENIITPVVTTVTTFIQNLINFFTNLWNTICNIFIVVCTWVNDNIITPVVDTITMFIQNVIDFFTNLWNTICNIFIVVCTWVNDNIVTPVTSSISSFIQGIKDFFQGLWDSIVDLFIKIDSWVGENIVDPVTETIRGFVNGILEFFENMANGVISLFESIVNGVVDAINSLSFDVPAITDWLGNEIFGGAHVGFSLSHISLDRVELPRLAQGTVVPPTSREFMAVLGDNKSETEVVSPLSTMKEAMLEALQEYGGNQNINLNVNGNMAALVRLLKIELDKEEKRKGTKLVTV